MSTVIIYKQDTGKIAVVMPTQEALNILGLEAIAEKDVPSGVKYKIIESSELPSTPQEEWTFSDSFFDSGVGK